MQICANGNEEYYGNILKFPAHIDSRRYCQITAKRPKYFRERVGKNIQIEKSKMKLRLMDENSIFTDCQLLNQDRPLQGISHTIA